MKVLYSASAVTALAAVCHTAKGQKPILAILHKILDLCQGFRVTYAIFWIVNLRNSFMANHKSAKKRIIRNANRAEINKSRISRIRTFIKKVENAITSGDQAAAQTALKEAQPEIMRGATKGVLHKNTASRKVSRLAARVKAVSA